MAVALSLVICRVDTMNKIWNFFDEDYSLELFSKKVLPQYPDFKKVEKVRIIPHKKKVWEETYHVVLEFKTYFRTKEGGVKSLSLFCSAHSDEPRKNVYYALKYLWNNDFGRSNLTIPRPLFYSDRYKATFYRGVCGKNLYNYIKEQDHKEIERIVGKAAYWFSKLHKMPTNVTGIYNFNKLNSRIRTAIPGKKGIMNSIGSRYPQYLDIYEQAYDHFIKKEEDFLRSTDKRYLIHGDSHPENIIKMSQSELAVIDFTDICLSDFARDLGCFLQQFEYMSLRKMGEEEQEFIERMKSLFLNNYFSDTKMELDESLQARINNYYYWTMMRSATFLLIKANPQPEEGSALVEEVRKYLNS